MRYRLQSSPAVYTPQILRWAINGFHFEEDREKLLKVMDLYKIPRNVATKLLLGEIPFEIEGEDVVFDF